MRAQIVDRERRVALIATVTIVLAFLAVGIAPIWVLALGPIVWGTPHLLADVRYLVVRPGLHRRAGVWLAIGAPVLVAGVTGLGVRVGWIACVGAFVVARGASLRTRVVGIAASLGLLALAWRDGATMDLLFAHAHNLVAVAMWWAWRPRERRAHWTPLVAFALGFVALAAGLADPIVHATRGFAPNASHLMPGSLLLALAPWPTHIVAAERAVLAFAFAQTVHYAVWVRFVPDEARAAHTPHSFRQTARSLVREMGPWIPFAALALTFAFAAWAVFDLVAAREGYLRFALFHGHLEVAVAALLWAERRRPC